MNLQKNGTRINALTFLQTHVCRCWINASEWSAGAEREARWNDFCKSNFTHCDIPALLDRALRTHAQAMEECEPGHHNSWAMR